ncbi:MULTISPECIES: glycosyltransferase family 2 protein [unclassified Flavobacterium]|uniref:glycosyltransferase family 2 protein n=1 Tax=unclassified Flavobacterium TaxID=196869 RepID=UPI0012B72F96|nr:MULTISPECIES: glycosyltransferase family 2 protein [unclassified Flavobacterium]
MLPKITVITASYNSEKTISDTIESVLNQKYPNIEYLIIDGNSSDNTISIIKQYENLFEGRLKYISEKDSGIYDAWNKGVKMAQGSWISFVGSDDIMFEDTFSDFIEFAKANENVNFISSKYLLVTENLKPIRVVGVPWSNSMNSYCCIAHVGSLHHKTLFDKKGIFDSNFKIAGDYDFLLRCRDIIRPGFVDMVSANVRDGGISGRQISRVARETVMAKKNNKSQGIFKIYTDYCIMIFKFVVRTNIINKLK